LAALHHAFNLFPNRLADTPSNLMTPTLFAKKVEEQFATLPNKDQVKIIAHDKCHLTLWWVKKGD
jgi:leucyl aminopeptidase